MYESTRQCRLKLKYEWEAWVHQVLNTEWDGKLWCGSQLTFVFNYIPGGFDRKCRVMEDEVERVYRTLVPHVERNPRSPSGRRRLPLLIAFPDYPTQRGSGDWRDVVINDGLHYHGIILVHIESRLKVRLDTHIKDQYRHYVRSGDILRRIHVQPVDEATSNRVTGYGLKALEWRIPDTDRLLILPKALSELGAKDRQVG